MSKIIVVDENDNEIGVKERSEIGPNDIYRVSGLWLTSSEGKILLAKRSPNKPKANHPNKWTVAVAGTVEEGETYEENMAKEIEEELGVKIKTTKSKKFFRDTVSRFFVQTFIAEVDLAESDFNIQEDEVAEVRWFTKEEILEKLKSDPAFFVPKFDQILKEFEVI